MCSPVSLYTMYRWNSGMLTMLVGVLQYFLILYNKVLRSAIKGRVCFLTFSQHLERKLSKKNKIKGEMEFVIDNGAKTDVEIEEA